MNKTLIYSGLGLAIVIGGSYTYFSSNNDKAEAVSTQDGHKVSQDESDNTEKVVVHKVSQAELVEAAKNFQEIESDVKGDDLFYYGMITMALQKLEFKGEENFSIPNTPDSIKRIQFDRANLQYFKNKAVELKASEPYQKILDKWLNGDFSNFENDYLTIRNIKGDPSQPSESPVLKVRTVEEEQKYIEHFFGNEGLQINKRDWL
ncbi:hypothetical protein ACFPA1_22260 [Neobacillus sp. GCM10023253]|uniref:hypothetical protein n=1 Tax=Neobacillus sp. GCM10023253 TaxID=3252644 RepID=UPI00360BCE6A